MMTGNGKSPRVSVIIPAYNAAAHLTDAVSSVLNQSFKDLEVVVVDDGSTDETPAIIDSFGDRIRHVRRKNGGVAEALNTGIALARGKYVGLLAADDLVRPGATEIQVRLLEQHPGAALLHGGAYEIDETGATLGVRQRRGPTTVIESSREAVKRLLRGNDIVCSSVMMRRSALSEVSGFNQECMPGEDWEMWLKLAARYDLIYTSAILASYRIHSQSLTAGVDLSSYAASHQRTLQLMFEEGGIGNHTDLAGYARAAHLRTMASIAAHYRRHARSFPYLARALGKQPSLIREAKTWATLFTVIKSSLPRFAIRLGRSLRSRLRSSPRERPEGEDAVPQRNLAR